MTQCVLNNKEQTSINNIVAEVGIFLPKVATPIAQAACVRAIMSIVDKAKLIQYAITQDSYYNVTGYPVEVPGCASILRVEEVYLNDVEVEFTVQGTSWVELLIAPGSDQVDGLKMDVYSGISADTCEIPTDIYERYGEVIINKTLSTLYGMFGEEWYSAEMVKFYGGIAKGGVDDIKQDTLEQEAPEGIKLSSAGGLVV